MTRRFRLECGHTRPWARPCISGLPPSLSLPGGIFWNCEWALQSTLSKAQFTHQPPLSIPQAWGVHIGSASFPRGHIQRSDARMSLNLSQGIGARNSRVLSRGQSLNKGLDGETWAQMALLAHVKEQSWKKAREGPPKMWRRGQPPLAECEGELFSIPIISLKTDIIIPKSSLPSRQSGKINSN